MNSYQRVLGAAIDGKVDKIPVVPLVRDWCTQQTGYTITDYMTSTERYTFSQFYCQKVYGYDAVLDLSGTHAESEAMGSIVKFSDSMPPTVMEPVIKDYKEDLSKLKILDPLRDGRLPQILEGINLLKKLCDGEVPVIGYLQGPCRQASMLRGIENLMRDSYKKVSDLEQLMELALNSQMVYGKALIKAGADVILVSDPASSGDLMSRKQWLKWSFPYLKRLVTSLKAEEPDMIVFLHICGDTRDRLDTFLDLGINGMSLDEKVDLGYARQEMGDNFCLIGNISPAKTLLTGTPDDVDSEARMCIEKAGRDGRFILCSGCMVPFDVKPENIKAMVSATEKYGRFKQPFSVERS